MAILDVPISVTAILHSSVLKVNKDMFQIIIICYLSFQLTFKLIKANLIETRFVEYVQGYKSGICNKRDRKSANNVNGRVHLIQQTPNSKCLVSFFKFKSQVHMRLLTGLCVNLWGLKHGTLQSESLATEPLRR